MLYTEALLLLKVPLTYPKPADVYFLFSSARLHVSSMRCTADIVHAWLVRPVLGLC